MAIGKVIIKQLAKVAKDSGKLDNAIDKIKEKVISKGLELVEESGIDSSQLPVNIHQYLRGESATQSPQLSTPDNVCAMPALTAQQAENTIRLINKAQIEIEKIYETTNNIKSTLLSIQTPINTLSNSIQPIETVITSVDVAVKTIKLIPIPTSVPPGIGIPTSILTTLSSVLDGLDKLLTIAKANVKMISPTLGVMTNLINGTVAKLNGIDGIIDPFLKTLTFIKQTAELRPSCPDVTQEDIDNIKDELLNNIQGNLALAQQISNPFAISDADLEEQLQANSDPGFIYKNFKFVLEYEPNNEFSFPPRRIRCTRTNSTGYYDDIEGGGSIQIFNVNLQTNPYLTEGSYSYSANIRILVEEAKFAVDNYTNNITLWVAPQIRENVSGSSGTFVPTDDITYLEAYEATFGFLPSPTNQPLPNYIRYGNYRVELNSSPTSIESGADRLLGEGGSSGEMITSYIQSGTIQVNKPVDIRMKTFGGTGNPSDAYTTGYTEALLTIKRSFSIQDNIDPFTGRVEGFDQDAIDTFVSEHESWSIPILDSVYETMMEVTGEFTGEFNPQGLAILSQGTFKERLEYLVADEFRFENGDFFADNIPDNIVNRLYDKAEPLLYNEALTSLSNKLYTNLDLLSAIPGDYTSGHKIGTILYGADEIIRGVEDSNSFYALNEFNWYKSAQQFNSAQNKSLSHHKKIATLFMFLLGFKQFLQTYQNLYGNRTDYNNGAWVGAASTLPIIPTQVGERNDDITISLQKIQLVNRNQTISEIVGSLSLLGTYTYDLEIIDSLPAVGGFETGYPTNYTEFYIETT